MMTKRTTAALLLLADPHWQETKRTTAALLLLALASVAAILLSTSVVAATLVVAVEALLAVLLQEVVAAVAAPKRVCEAGSLAERPCIFHKGTFDTPAKQNDFRTASSRVFHRRAHCSRAHKLHPTDNHQAPDKPPT